MEKSRSEMQKIQIWDGKSISGIRDEKIQIRDVKIQIRDEKIQIRDGKIQIRNPG